VARNPGGQSLRAVALLYARVGTEIAIRQCSEEAMTHIRVGVQHRR